MLIEDGVQVHCTLPFDSPDLEPEFLDLLVDLISHDCPPSLVLAQFVCIVHRLGNVNANLVHIFLIQAYLALARTGDSSDLVLHQFLDDVVVFGFVLVLFAAATIFFLERR